MSNSPRHHLPELLRGKRFRVTEGAPTYSDTTGRSTVSVPPLSSGPAGEYHRMVYLARAARREVIDSIRRSTGATVEEIAVIQRLADHETLRAVLRRPDLLQVGAPPIAESAAWIGGPLAPYAPYLAAVSLSGCGPVYTRFLAQLPPDSGRAAGELVATLRRQLRAGGYSKSAILDAIRYLHASLTPPPPPPPVLPPLPYFLTYGATSEGQIASVARMRDAWQLLSPSPEVNNTGGAGPRLWGAMSIHRPRLCIRHRPRGGRRRFKVDYAGILRDPARLPSGLSTGKVFSTPARRGGGSFLFDLSGSMGPNPRVLEILLGACPGAIIGAYFGNDRQTGQLHILARGGRMVDFNAWQHATKNPGGNTVDGPALEWLARQRAPRVWISDGRHTGPGEYHKRQDHVESITKSASIRCISSFKTAEAEFEFGRKSK